MDSETQNARGAIRLLLCGLVWVLLAAPVAAQTLHHAFNPSADAAVRAVAVQADGKLLVGGDFTTINGSGLRALARVRNDGSLDPDFNAQIANGSVWAVAVQPDGRILIGGTFTQIGISQRLRIARLNPDGSLDASFNANASANGVVRVLALHNDGRILLGGDFTELNEQGRMHIGRLQANGSLDGPFNPGTDGNVLSLLVQPNGRILVGGAFSEIANQNRPRLARLHSNGSVDAGFNTGIINNTVRAIALQVDGYVIIGGAFSQVGLATRNRLARLQPNGTLDFDYDPDFFNGDVLGLALQPDGQLLAVGSFRGLKGGTVARNRIARILFNGDHDPTFDPNVNELVHAVAIQSDGKPVFGGLFTRLSSLNLVRDRIARVYADGLPEGNFQADANGLVYSLSAMPGGALTIAGTFNELGGPDHPHIAQVHSNGSANHNFTSWTNSGVSATAIQSDGKVLLGGGFSIINDQPRARLARLNASGTLDTGFQPQLIGTFVRSLAIQADGRILIAGNFTSVGGVSRWRLARLNANGSLDPSFVPPFPEDQADLFSIAVQPDGRILVAGKFRTTVDEPWLYVARLHPDGSLDPSFQAGVQADPNDGVFAIMLQPDGRILIGGRFNQVGSAKRSGLARLKPDGSPDESFNSSTNGTPVTFAALADGRIWVGGFFTQIGGGSRTSLARLRSDGSLDTSFNLVFDQVVLGLTILPDGKLAIGGAFETIGTVPRLRLGRLSAPDSALQRLTLQGRTVAWMRSGSSPELALPPQLQISLNGVTFATIATMTRIPGGWTVENFEPPYGQIFYLRTLGQVSSGQNNASRGLIQSTAQFYELNPKIFHDRFQAGGM